jgi:hypothetical protein
MRLTITRSTQYTARPPGSCQGNRAIVVRRNWTLLPRRVSRSVTSSEVEPVYGRASAGAAGCRLRRFPHPVGPHKGCQRRPTHRRLANHILRMEAPRPARRLFAHAEDAAASHGGREGSRRWTKRPSRSRRIEHRQDRQLEDRYIWVHPYQWRDPCVLATTPLRFSARCSWLCSLRRHSLSGRTPRERRWHVGRPR